MKSFYLPLRTSIVTTITLMGVLGVVLMYAGTGIYHDKSIDNHRKDLTVLIGHEIETLLVELEKDGSQLALNAQNSSRFKQAYASRDIDALTRQLENEFRQYFVTANLIRLVKLVLLDTNYEYLTEASAILNKESDDTGNCSQLLSRAQERKGIDRLRTISQLCVSQGSPLHGLIVPIGGLKPTGYFMLVSDPINKLLNIEHSFRFPLEITDPEGKILHRSRNWPTGSSELTLTAIVPLTTPQGIHVMNVTVAKDISTLIEELTSTRQIILGLAVAATLISIVLSLLILNRAIFYPLNRLNDLVKRHTEHQLDTGSPQSEDLSSVDIDIVGAPAIKGLYKNLREMAMTDPLTLTHNRYLFSDRMKQILKISARANAMAAIILIDLDHFKQVNDTYGHHIGDELLKAVVSRIREILRESDQIVRLGGDEFTVLLPFTDVAQAEVVTAKILRAMRQSFELDGIKLEIKCSVGIAMYPEDSEDHEVLMQMADKAMYQAKTSDEKLVYYKDTAVELQDD